jgi:hypothetical protein
MVLGTNFVSRKVCDALCSAFANISGCFTPSTGTVDRDQERMPRVLDLDTQILETMEENLSTSTR